MKWCEKMTQIHRAEIFEIPYESVRLNNLKDFEDIQGKFMKV